MSLDPLSPFWFPAHQQINKHINVNLSNFLPTSHCCTHNIPLDWLPMSNASSHQEATLKYFYNDYRITTSITRTKWDINLDSAHLERLGYNRIRDVCRSSCCMTKGLRYTRSLPYKDPNLCPTCTILCVDWDRLTLGRVILVGWAYFERSYIQNMHVAGAFLSSIDAW